MFGRKIIKMEIKIAWEVSEKGEKNTCANITDANDEWQMTSER